jgi:tetratricopeptide (TPR) repeat protein
MSVIKDKTGMLRKMPIIGTLPADNCPKTSGNRCRGGGTVQMNRVCLSPIEVCNLLKSKEIHKECLTAASASGIIANQGCVKMKCSHKQNAKNWDCVVSPQKKNKAKFGGWILILSCLFLITAPYQAKAEEEDKFRELFDKGMSYYESQMFAEALQAFREVLKIRVDYQTYFNIGQCEFLLKHYDLALEALSTSKKGAIK